MNKSLITTLPPKKSRYFASQTSLISCQVLIKQGSTKYPILTASLIEDMVEEEQRPDGNPVDLVGNMRAIIDQERARQGENFHAAWFLRSNLDLLSHAGAADQEKGLFFDDLRIAWGLVAWEALAEYHDTVYEETLIYVGVMQRFERLPEKKLQISPLGVVFLDAMAEAIGLEYTPGQDTFDLSLFDSWETMARIERGLVPQGHSYPLPTSQEVQMAITKSVDTHQE
jgi:hypothetical protein